MNKLLCFTQGQPVVLDDIVFVDAAYRDALYGFLTSFGLTEAESYKLSGAEVDKQGDYYICSAGYVVIEGEIYYVPAHSKFISSLSGNTAAFKPIISYDTAPAGNKLFYLSQTVKQCYEIRRAGLVAIAPQPANFMPYDAPNILQVIGNGGEWIAPVFEAGWSNLGGAHEECKYRISKQGVVQLKGVVTSNTPTGIIFVLPDGYRPLYEQFYPCFYGSQHSVIRIDPPSGEVIVLQGNVNQDIDLSSISFKIY